MPLPMNLLQSTQEKSLLPVTGQNSGDWPFSLNYWQHNQAVTILNEDETTWIFRFRKEQP